MNNITKERAADLAKHAAEKLQKEMNGVVGNKEKAMAAAVKAALCDFAAQDAEFAEAIIFNSQTFGNCMAAVAKGVGSSISDIEAYKRAVQFYFPGAEIDFTMTVRVNPHDAPAAPNTAATYETHTLSLMDILGK